MGKRDRFSKKKDERRKIASERIVILMELAEKEALENNLSRADRYGQLAFRIAQRYNAPLPTDFKHRFCKRCGTYRVHGLNTKTRLTGRYVTVSCGKCGSMYRKPYKAPRKKDLGAGSNGGKGDG